MFIKKILYLIFIIQIIIIFSCQLATEKSSDSNSSGTVIEGLAIQESETGFLNAYPGKVYTDKAGYTGSGFYSYNSGLGANINWSVNASAAGTYKLCFRYAFGGTETNYRDAKIVVNGVVVTTLTSTETGGFTYTKKDWSVWNETKLVEVTLLAGDNHIRLESVLSTGLANIDYIRLVGTDGLADKRLTAGSSSLTTYHAVTVSVKTSGTGTAAITSPLDTTKSYYAKGESVTATATAGGGYTFSAWTGYSSSNPYIFTVPGFTSTSASGDVALTAVFNVSGLQNPADLVGYATVQNDSGLSNVVYGGTGGAAVTATNLTDLTTYLATTDPMTITVSGTITSGSDTVSTSLNVASNKTILGANDGTGHLKNIELKLANVENIIIRNLTVSEVVAHDAYGGTGNDCIVISGSKYIWIDHCDFYSNLNAGGDTSVTTEEEIKDYYDGLLDVKNASSFITVSWCTFKNHWKACLFSSGDTQTGDTVIRITMHHNYFYNCVSRTPLIRFGKAHIYNNYYYFDTSITSSSSCVNSRIGAEVFVENNYFQSVKNTIGFYYETTYPTGYWNVSSNTFESCTGDPTSSTCSYTPPYSYTADSAAAAKTNVTSNAGVGKITF